MFGLEDEEALRELWLGSAVSLKDRKWAIVGDKKDSVQIEGGKVRIKVFEGGSKDEGSRALPRHRLVLGDGERCLLRSAGAAGRPRSTVGAQPGGRLAEIEVFTDGKADGSWAVMTKTGA